MQIDKRQTKGHAKMKSWITVYYGEDNIGDTSDMTEAQIADAEAEVNALERAEIKRRFGKKYDIEFRSGYGPNGATVEAEDESIIPYVEQAIADAFDKWCSK